MAANKLGPELDIEVRKIFKAVADSKLNKVARDKILRVLLKELNYQWLPSGVFVDAGTQITVPFGTTDTTAYVCEWEADEEKALEAIDNKDTVEASASSEGTDTEVREAVLPEDVL